MTDTKNKTFNIVALGCRTNQYEAQAFKDQLLESGYQQAGKEEVADLCIVNTCTVTESADRASRHEIRKLAKNNPGARLVVTGCSAEKQPERIRQIKGVTDLVANRSKENLLPELFPEEQFPEFSIKNFDSRTRAFVKVQDGCNSFCTYCILPYVRGRSRSRNVSDIIEEVERLIARGFKEVVLTGINIGDFDGNESQEKIGLSDLVRAVDQVSGLRRLRVSSIDPDEVDDDLTDAIINGKTTCPSMHIVLQSGSNVILKRMNRKYTRQIFMETIGRLRRAEPDFTFTTDVIVGFPGETEADFNETLEVIKETQFVHVHMFPFSPRPRTRAALYPDRIAQPVMQARKQQVLRLSEKIAFEARQKYVGRIMTVLTEEGSTKASGQISGRTPHFLNVLVDGEDLEPNQIVPVVIEQNTPEGLKGRLISCG